MTKTLTEQQIRKIIENGTRKAAKVCKQKFYDKPKSLTEQWREGKLEQRYYYVKYFGNGQKPFVEIELKNFLLDLVKVKDRDKIEVLEPVPSYDEYKDLETKCHQLEKELVLNKLEPIHLHNCIARIAELEEKNKNARKKVKKLQEQIRIATKALKGVCVWANTGNGGEKAVKKVCEKAIKEMEGVK